MMSDTSQLEPSSRKLKTQALSLGEPGLWETPRRHQAPQNPAPQHQAPQHPTPQQPAPQHLPLPLTLPLVLLFSALPLSALAQQYCDTAWFWSANFSRTPGNADWSSYGRDAGFGKGPCLLVSGIQMTVTYQSTIIITDRSGTSNSYATLPNSTTPAFGEEIILATSPQGPLNAPTNTSHDTVLPSNAQRPLNVLTNTFCSSGAHMPNGDLYSIGGGLASSGQYLSSGVWSVRGFRPCRDGQCDFWMQGYLRKGRWYPTSVLLPDGRVIIVGGSGGGVALNSQNANRPYIEYFPSTAGPVLVQLLEDTLPYNLYPFVHVLPSGNVFIFAGSKWVIWNTSTDNPVPGSRPELVQWAFGGQRVYRSYPLSGTSALLPLRPGSPAEILICGGASTAANGVNGTNAYAMADNRCNLIQPEAKNPTWTTFQMRFPRIMPNAVLLPDGHVLLVNGAQTGWAGIGTVEHEAVLFPEMFNSSSKTFYGNPLPASKIPRSYHSSAILLGDASVFISGSNPHYSIVLGGDDFPTEFRTEFFFPPFAKNGTARPTIVNQPGTIYMNHGFNITVAHNSVTTVQVVLAHPGFSTHGNNHGMRNVVLPVLGVNGRPGTFSINVGGCPSKNICLPTWYWLFVVINGIPSINSNCIFVK